MKSDLDVTFIASAAKEIWEEHFTSIIGSAQTAYMLQTFQSESAISEQLRSGLWKYFVIEHNCVHLGYTALIFPKNSCDLRLSKFYLYKKYRGQGFGRLALNQIEQIAYTEGRTAIVLSVNRHNTSSIKAYQAFGFYIEKEEVNNIGQGFVMDDYVMRKELLERLAQ